jgi:XTP/dITP diphosphohydrolase
MPARIVLLVTSPRLPAGLLTATAWELLRTHSVLAAEPTPTVAAVRAAGVDVHLVASEEGALVQAQAVGGCPSSIATWVSALLAAAAEHETVVWLAGPTGDPELARELGLRLAQQPRLATLELVHGSWDPAGGRLLDAVAVIDRLVSPGGDPWKRAQTHASLARYLLEEAYEAHDAIESGDPTALREELGDVLLQVLLHARLAEEAPEGQRWSIDDLAGEFVTKMIRRNPHVFAGVEVSGMEDILENWERIKREEKPRRAPMEGIVASQPALSLAAKIFERAERAGIDPHSPPAPPGVDAGDPTALGEALLALAAAAHAAGVDPEAALRRAALAHAERLQAEHKP